MRTHSFDVDLAEKYGVAAAILLRHIMYWCEQNKANGKNKHDGKYWMYTSRKALHETFRYLGEYQIRAAREKLLENGLIEVGNYNAKPFDRTLWYSATPKAYKLYYGPSPQLANYSDPLAETANAIGENSQPIPNIKQIQSNTPCIILTDNTSPKGETADGVTETDAEVTASSPTDTDLFALFWTAYPRKVAKPAALKMFRRANICSVKDLDPILADIARRKASGEWTKDRAKYIPHPATYLSQRRWEDEQAGQDTPPPAATDYFKFYG